MRPRHIGPNLTFQLFQGWTMVDSTSHYTKFDFSIVSGVDLGGGAIWVQIGGIFTLVHFLCICLVF